MSTAQEREPVQPLKPWSLTPGDNPTDAFADLRFRISRAIYLLDEVATDLGGGGNTTHRMFMHVSTVQEVLDLADEKMSAFAWRLQQLSLLMLKVTKKAVEMKRRAVVANKRTRRSTRRAVR